MNQSRHRIHATIRVSDLLTAYREQQKTPRARRFICTMLAEMLKDQLQHHPRFSQFLEDLGQSCNNGGNAQEMYNFIFMHMEVTEFEDCIVPKLNNWCMETFHQQFRNHHDLDTIAVERNMTFFEVRERMLQHAISNNPDDVIELDFS